MSREPAFKPGDLVTRTGETAFGVSHGADYIVRSRRGGFIRLNTTTGNAIDGEYRARGFRPSEEGKT